MTFCNGLDWDIRVYGKDLLYFEHRHVDGSKRTCFIVPESDAIQKYEIDLSCDYSAVAYNGLSAKINIDDKRDGLD